MLIAQSKQVKELEEKLKRAEEALKVREIHIAEAGSIAEASLRIHGVFETAQSAAEIYLDNVGALVREQERLQQQAEADFESWREQRRLQTERQCLEAEEDTRRKCDEMLQQAQVGTQKYWDEIVRRLEPVYEEFPGLKDRLSGSSF